MPIQNTINRYVNFIITHDILTINRTLGIGHSHLHQ